MSLLWQSFGDRVLTQTTTVTIFIPRLFEPGQSSSHEQTQQRKSTSSSGYTP
jgi:hypothetical protein